MIFADCDRIRLVLGDGCSSASNEGSVCHASTALSVMALIRNSAPASRGAGHPRKTLYLFDWLTMALFRALRGSRCSDVAVQYKDKLARGKPETPRLYPFSDKCPCSDKCHKRGVWTSVVSEFQV